MEGSLEIQRKRVEKRVESVLRLSLALQAECICSAVELSLPVLKQHAHADRIFELIIQMIGCFNRWLAREAGDAELYSAREGLLAAVPNDLTEQTDPRAGMLGFAALDIAVIALNDAADVHDSILWTAISYAAGAACMRVELPYVVGTETLTEKELEFLSRWWSLCCDRVPQLEDEETENRD